MLNKEPIYLQINKALKIRIQSGDFQIGDKFLTERAVCDLFQVSRATANKALSSLVSQKILEFKKGLGTFIQSIPQEKGRTLSERDERVSSYRVWEEFRNTEDLQTTIRQLIPFAPSEKTIRLIKTIFKIENTVVLLEEKYIFEEKYPVESKNIIEILPLTASEAYTFSSTAGETGFVITSISENQMNGSVELVKSRYRPGSIRIIHNQNLNIEFLL
jgi:DNA-binding GntR family transcriptional regulator